MKAKTLENLLAYESGLHSEMVTRFQTLRGFNLLSKGRGRNAEFLNTQEVVAGILSVAAGKSGMAATTAIGLRNLQPVGAQEDAFAQAPTLGLALAAALENPALLATVKKVYLGDSDPISVMATSAEIIYQDGGNEYSTQYVPATAKSLFHEGAEIDFDRHSLNKQSISREVIISGRLLTRIAQEIREARERESASRVRYTIWCGLAQNEAEYVAMKPNWMPRVRDSLHDALWDAMTINDARQSANDRVQVVWEIEGSDGSSIGRQEVAHLVNQHRPALLARPPQKY